MENTMKDILHRATKAIMEHRERIRPAIEQALRPAITREVVRSLHIKQATDTEEKLAEALAPVIRKQVEEISDNLMKLEGDNGAIQTIPPIDTEKHHAAVVDAAFPILAVKAVEAAVSQMMALGVDIRKKSCRTKHLPGQHNQLDHGRGGGGARVNLAPDTGVEIGGGGGGGSVNLSHGEDSINYMKMKGDAVHKKVGEIFSKDQMHEMGIVGTGYKGRIVKYDVLDFLSKENASKYGKVTDYSEASSDKLSIAMAKELQHAISIDKTAVGWYDARVKGAMKNLSKIHPELGRDVNGEPVDAERLSVFKGILAITSNGQTVKANWKGAEEIYTQWKETGEFTVTPATGGRRWNSVMKGQFEFMQEKIKKDDIGGLKEFFNGRFKVTDLREIGFPTTGELVKDPITGEPTTIKGSEIYGAKLGSFYNNMSGDYSTVTVDMWFMESFSRLRGDATDPSTTAFQKQAKGIKESLDGLPKERLHGFNKKDLLKELGQIEKHGRLDDDKGIVLKWAKEERKRNEQIYKKDKTKKDEVGAIAENLYDNARGIKAAYAGATEMDFIRRTVRKTQARLKADGMDLTTADMQAVWWYYEKNLTQKFGIVNNKAAPMDYEQASSWLVGELKQKGKLVNGVRVVKQAGGAPEYKPNIPSNFDGPDEFTGDLSQEITDYFWENLFDDESMEKLLKLKPVKV